MTSAALLLLKRLIPTSLFRLFPLIWQFHYISPLYLINTHIGYAFENQHNILLFWKKEILKFLSGLGFGLYNGQSVLFFVVWSLASCFVISQWQTVIVWVSADVFFFGGGRGLLWKFCFSDTSNCAWESIFFLCIDSRQADFLPLSNNYGVRH